MDINPKSKKPMTKEEVAQFVDLIQNYAIISSKETNAATNKHKEDAWVSVTAAYNAKCGGFPKQKDQLKLKWDNLKKAARKRSQTIRMNMFKTGGGKPIFIPNDEILDRVSSLMGSTCMGFEVPYGGDGIDPGSVVMELEVDGSEEAIESNQNIARVQMPDVDLLPSTSTANKRKNILLTPEGDIGEVNEGVKFLYGMPTMAKSLKNKGKKKKIEEKDDGRAERNLAIANYYITKKEKLDLEIRQFKLELANKEGKENNSLV